MTTDPRPDDAAPADPHPDDAALAEAFWTVAGRLRHGVRDTVGQYGISPAHFRALGVLLRHGDMRLRELSDHLHIAPRSTTEVVDALQERGLVRRQPDPDDRRATIVVVTAEGQRMRDALHTVRMRQGAEMFGRLDAHDRAELARILGLLAVPR